MATRTYVERNAGKLREYRITAELATHSRLERINGELVPVLYGAGGVRNILLTEAGAQSLGPSLRLIPAAPTRVLFDVPTGDPTPEAENAATSSDLPGAPPSTGEPSGEAPVAPAKKVEASATIRIPADWQKLPTDDLLLLALQMTGDDVEVKNRTQAKRIIAAYIKARKEA